MKLYILTCVNEEGDVVYVQPFVNRDLAHATMSAQYNSEREKYIFNENLCEDRDFYGDIEASVGSEEVYCYWKIHEREL